MTSRVRLNVPPRVIESARAAQHANREALSARQAAERIRGKAEQQQAAERRAQGLRAPTAGATAQQRQIDGGQLEFTRRKGQRIWTRRRVVDVASFGVAYIANWYTGDVNSPNFSGFLYPRRIYSGDGSTYLEFYRDRRIGPDAPTINEVSWRDDTYSYTSEEEVREVLPFGYPPGHRMWNNGNEGAGWSILPAGNKTAVIVYSHIDFYAYYGITGPYPFDPFSLQLVNGPEGAALVQRAFLVGRSSVREIAVGSGFRSFILPAEPAFRRVRYINSFGATIGVNRRVYGYTARAWPFSFEIITGVSNPILNSNTAFLLDIHPNAHMQAFIRSRFGDIDSGGDARLRGFGPGVYAYIKNPTVARAAFDAAGSGLWQKEAAAESVIGYGLPPSLADSTVTPGLALSYQGSYPPTSNAYPPVNGVDAPQWERQDEPITYAPFSTIDVTVETTPQAIPIQKVLFWDWGDPTYCRRQLLDLGFAEQDLTP